MEKTEEITVQASLDKILNSYSAENSDHPNWFIYEYQTGRKVLVEVDNDSGKVRFLREL